MSISRIISRSRNWPIVSSPPPLSALISKDYCEYLAYHLGLASPIAVP